ncbi:hypothetical protein JW926_17755 [Candidatus Sumerlaeota bacterium]|nr:hypothetical protein [Candidatus Sumerlaeota bacterium]
MMKNLIFILEKISTARVVILNRTTEPFQKDVNSLPGEIRERFEIHSFSQRELSVVLMASDIALLLRKDDLVNRVACPTKFAEYLG